ncbi:EF-hand domain-containing protein D2-like [Clavelina lepadiformis]|uniref:EF-hand domain-containing protein D2-like n=1 Tax=Clavelina lepadiformis TaxID=159417 RepID=UPI0040418F64
MADELSARLARRQNIIEGDEPAPAENLEPKCNERKEDDKSTTDAAGGELADKLMRQGNINEGKEATANPSAQHFNPYTEFKEFSRKQIKDLEKKFKGFDEDRDHFINLLELKRAMEKLGEPQTHLGLKAMIKEVDEDLDNQISFREFLLIFRKAAAGELQIEGLKKLASDINVSEEGVSGAKNFFEAKVNQLSDSNRFEQEIKKEQEDRKKQNEEKKQRQAAFKEKAMMFQ